MSTARVPRGSALLALLVVVLWIAVALHAFGRDSAWLDDAFITLHVSGNVLEQGTARYFPIAENPSLLASSPLRMLVLVPSLAIARLVTDVPRSLEEAEVAFVLAGIVTCLLAGVFFRGRRQAWLAGCAGAALLCLATESALQMEGLLLAWLAWALLLNGARSSPARTGAIVGLALLARPEFGLAAILVLGVAMLVQSRRNFLRFVAALCAVGAVWIVVAAALGVWPVPTTILTKILSATNHVFRSPPFGAVWPRSVRGMFLFRLGTDALAWPVLAVIAVALATSGRRVVAGLVVWILALSALWTSPGNYPWYHENVAILLLVLAIAGLAGGTGRAGALHRARVMVLAGFVGMFLLSSTGRDRPTPYGFEEGPRRGRIYRDVALHHVGQGLFQFPGGERTYLHVTEIGMIAWFAGGDVWLADHFGLAQLRNLDGARESAAAVLYPNAVMRDYVEEFDRVVRRAGPPTPWIQLSGVEIEPRLMFPERCSYRSPSGLYCVVPFYDGPIEDMSRDDPQLP